jgi:hypothetical protein
MANKSLGDKDAVVLGNKSTLCVLGYNIDLDLKFHFYYSFMEEHDTEATRKSFESEFTEKVKAELNEGFFYGDVDVLTEKFRAFGEWRISRKPSKLDADTVKMVLSYWDK